MVLRSLTERTVAYIRIPCSILRETQFSVWVMTSVSPSPISKSIANRLSVLSNDVWYPWSNNSDKEETRRDWQKSGNIQRDLNR